MSEPMQDSQVDPIAFTKERIVEIGEVWKSYALSKKSEALSKMEGSIDKAPPQIKKLFGRVQEHKSKATSTTDHEAQIDTSA